MDAKLTPLDRLRKVQEALACAELFTCKNAHQQSAGKVLTIIKDSQALIPSLMADLETVEVELQFENIPFVARCIKCNPPKEE